MGKRGVVYLFTKKDCPACRKLKRKYAEQLEGALEVEGMSVNGIAFLCQFELFEFAQKVLPIIVITENEKVTHRAGGYDRCAELLERTK